MSYYVLSHVQARRNAIKSIMEAPDGYAVRITEPNRTLEQNAKMWPLLHDISQQVNWYGNKLTEEEWKDVFTAALKKQKVVPGIDGGFVVCGQRTSKMNKSDFSELIEIICAFGAQHNVEFKHDQVPELQA